MIRLAWLPILCIAAIGIVAGCFLVYRYLDGSYQDRLANADSAIKSQRETITLLTTKLQVGSPEAAASKIDSIVREVADLKAQQTSRAEPVSEKKERNSNGTFSTTKTVLVRAPFTPPVFIIEIFSKDILDWQVSAPDQFGAILLKDVDTPDVKSGAISNPYGRYIIAVTTKDDMPIRFNLRFDGMAK